MAHFGIQAIPPMPPGQTDQNAWVAALQNGWVTNLKVPLTQVYYLDKVTLSPPCDPLTSHTFTRRMLAFPLTINGPQGSEPDGKSSWWTSYFNTKATGHAKRAWVQGHLLNHHLHGPGVAENLVPITDQLNRIMEKWAEKVVKDMVLAKGHILKYQVTVDWRCGMTYGGGGLVGQCFKACASNAQRLRFPEERGMYGAYFSAMGGMRDPVEWPTVGGRCRGPVFRVRGNRERHLSQYLELMASDPGRDPGAARGPIAIPGLLQPPKPTGGCRSLMVASTQRLCSMGTAIPKLRWNSIGADKKRPPL
ncbi:MAG: hypothetical protein WBE76_20930 [Terracidiphilus sp.]